VQADLVTLLQCFYSEMPYLKIINMSEKELLPVFHSKKKKKKELNKYSFKLIPSNLFK